MINIIAVESKQSSYNDFFKELMQCLHSVLKEENGINYIIYKPDQSIDKVVVDQMPSLRRQYPGKHIKITQYRNADMPTDPLGYPKEIIDMVDLFPGKESYYLDAKFIEKDPNNFLEPALRTADIVLAMSKQDLYLASRHCFNSLKMEERKYKFKVALVANSEIQEKNEKLLAALPETERRFVEYICDRDKVFPSMMVKFRDSVFRRHVADSLLLQEAGFSLYGLYEMREENSPKRVLLLQSDHFCDKPLGDILYKKLETLFKEEDAIDFIFGPCMGDMAAEAAKMIAGLKKKYPDCKVTLVRALDPNDLYLYLTYHRDEWRKEMATPEAIRSCVEKCTARFPDDLPSHIALCASVIAPSNFSSLSRRPFDQVYKIVAEGLLRETDMALIYHYPNAADQVCRILRSVRKSSLTKVVSLYDPKVYDVIDSHIAQLPEVERKAYRAFCDGMNAKRIGEQMGESYHQVYKLMIRLLENLEEKIPDVSSIGDPDAIREACLKGLEKRRSAFSPFVWEQAGLWLERIGYDEDRFSLEAFLADDAILEMSYLTRRQIKTLLRQITVEDLGVSPDAWDGEQNVRMLDGIDIEAEAEYYVKADAVPELLQAVFSRYGAEDVLFGYQKSFMMQAAWNGIRPLPPALDLPCSFFNGTMAEVAKKLEDNDVKLAFKESDRQRFVVSLWNTFTRLEILYGSGVAYRLSKGDTRGLEALDVDERVFYGRMAEELYPEAFAD